MVLVQADALRAVAGAPIWREKKLVGNTVHQIDSEYKRERLRLRFE